jgi:hypothetical protein
MQAFAERLLFYPDEIMPTTVRQVVDTRPRHLDLFVDTMWLLYLLTDNLNFLDDIASVFQLPGSPVSSLWKSTLNQTRLSAAFTSLL